MADLAKLITELTTDPLARGYAGMSDIEATNSLNAIDRPGPISTDPILRYLYGEKNRTNDGADLVSSQLYGRIKLVCEAETGADTFLTATGNELATIDRKASAITILSMLSNPQFLIDFSDNKMQNLFQDMRTAGAISANQKNEIIAKSLGVKPEGKTDEQLKKLISDRMGQKKIDDSENQKLD